MPRLETDRGFVGAVRDPEHGDLIQLGSDIDTQTAERCAEAYSHLSIAGVTQPTNEDGKPLCVGKENGQCSRVVDAPGEECWQHES